MQPQQRGAQARQADGAALAVASASAAADATQQAAGAILLQGQPVLDTSAPGRIVAPEERTPQGPTDQPLAPPAATATAAAAYLQPAGHVQLLPGDPATTGARSQLRPGDLAPTDPRLAVGGASASSSPSFDPDLEQ
eukprot:13671845-Alexandrium_andersonii.AAC.1